MSSTLFLAQYCQRYVNFTVFSKSELFKNWFSLLFVFSSSLVSVFIFVVHFLLLDLSSFCTSFSKCFRRSLDWFETFPSFVKCLANTNPSYNCFSHVVQIWCLIFSFSFSSEFLEFPGGNSSLIHTLFRMCLESFLSSFCYLSLVWFY